MSHEATIGATANDRIVDRRENVEVHPNTDGVAGDIAAWESAAERFEDVPSTVQRTRSTYTPDVWPAQRATVKRDAKERTWHDIMPECESEWDAERRRQQAMLKLLPRRVRQAVTRLRSTYLREAVLELAFNELLRRAAKHDRLFETRAATELLEAFHEPREYVPAPAAEKLAREMGQDSAFMLRMFKMAKASARQARMLNTWSPRSLPSNLPRVRLPRSRMLRVEAWSGLTEIPLPHCPPEGLLVGLAQRCLARHARATRSLRVLDWGAGNSPFTRALLAVKHSRSNGETSWSGYGGSWRRKEWLCVDEVDTLGDAPPDLSFVRRTHAVTRGRVCDFVIVQLPPPCATRGGYRDRFKELPAGKTGQVRLSDLGRLGARRWVKSVPRVVHSVLAATAGSREFVLLIPLFAVGAPSEANPAEGVLAQLREALRAATLTVTHDFTVQPTEGREHWQCLIASSSASPKAQYLLETDLDDCPDIDAILEAIA